MHIIYIDKKPYTDNRTVECMFDDQQANLVPSPLREEACLIFNATGLHTYRQH
jgi:hypothetical protein